MVCRAVTNQARYNAVTEKVSDIDMIVFAIASVSNEVEHAAYHVVDSRERVGETHRNVDSINVLRKRVEHWHQQFLVGEDDGAAVAPLPFLGSGDDGTCSFCLEHILGAVDNMNLFLPIGEMASETGVDEMSFFHSRFSERKLLKTARLEKIAISAMKQSRKAWKPVLHEILSFKEFLAMPVEGRKYIAHCYEEIPRTSLFAALQSQPDAATESVTVLIGPEGDFSIDEVRMAIDAGYQSVHLGNSRLRTETAGLMAVTMMQLSKQ